MEMTDQSVFNQNDIGADIESRGKSMRRKSSVRRAIKQQEEMDNFDLRNVRSFFFDPNIIS